jgi:hypothetical protein
VASDIPDSFQCGAFEVAKNPNVSQFVEKLNRLREAVDQCRLQPGVGYTLNRSSGGTTLSINTGSQAAQANKRPFEISIRKKDTKYEFYIATGILNNGTAIDNLEKWVAFDAQPPVVIYLEAKLSNLEITSVTVKSKKQDGLLETIEISGGKQTYARIALGFYAGSGKTFNIVQNVFTNINTTNVCHDGFPALSLSQESLAA